LTNDDPRIDGVGNAVADFGHFVEDMARFTTVFDELQDDEFRAAFAKEHGLKPEEVGEDEVLAELSEERLYSETMTFWEMIRRARQLLARVGRK
jgi:hypothetical protein